MHSLPIGNRSDRHRYRPPDSISLGENTQESLVDAAVVELQLEASPAYAGVAEYVHRLFAEYHRYHRSPPRRVNHQPRLRDGFAESVQAGEVIRQDVNQRRAVMAPICLVPRVIQAQYLRFILCLCHQGSRHIHDSLLSMRTRFSSARTRRIISGRRVSTTA